MARLANSDARVRFAAIAAVADARLTLNVSVGHSGRRTLASAHIEDQ